MVILVVDNTKLSWSNSVYLLVCHELPLSACCIDETTGEAIWRMSNLESHPHLASLFTFYN